MSDNRKEAEEKMKKAIFISADCWLCVFDLLPTSQLGLGIALISHRFDLYIDEHFKTRKWTLKSIQIDRKFGKNGTKQMEIINHYWKPLPIPQNPLPKKIVGFKDISIEYIDNNAIAFLHRFRPLFAVCPINLAIDIYYTDRIMVFLLQNIWPMLGKNIHGLRLSSRSFYRLRHFVPSILNNCPSLRVVISCDDDFFIEFPSADNAMASDGQALAKWLFTPLQNNVPKMLKCSLDMDYDGNLATNVEAFKAAFANASSPVNFIVVISFPFAYSVVPFDLTNGFTREQLELKRTEDYNNRFLFVRCPIARDESKWTKWEKEAIGLQIYNQWNQIDFRIYSEDDIGDGLLDTTPGPSDQQK